MATGPANASNADTSSSVSSPSITHAGAASCDIASTSSEACSGAGSSSGSGAGSNCKFVSRSAYFFRGDLGVCSEEGWRGDEESREQGE